MNRVSLTLWAVSVAISQITSGCIRSSEPLAARNSLPGRIEVHALQVDDPYNPKNPFNTPAAGSRFVAAHIVVRNVSEQTVTIEPTESFELVGRLGISYQVAVLVEEPSDLSFGGSSLGVIPPGASIEGFLPFQMPLSDEPARLRLISRDSYRDIELPPPAATSTPAARDRSPAPNN